MTNEEKAMEQGIWVGKEVWDCTRKESNGVVTQIKEIMGCAHPVIVRFKDFEGSYTLDRRGGYKD